MDIVTTTSPTVAFDHMRLASSDRVQVHAKVERTIDGHTYDHIVGVGEFEVSRLATKRGMPRAVVGDWFLDHMHAKCFTVVTVSAD